MRWLPENAWVAAVRGVMNSLLLPQLRPKTKPPFTSPLCRFCCRSRLPALANSDSVVVRRTVSGAGDDGAAEARPAAAVLFVLPGRDGAGGSPGPRDRCRPGSFLGSR